MIRGKEQRIEDLDIERTFSKQRFINKIADVEKEIAKKNILLNDLDK